MSNVAIGRVQAQRADGVFAPRTVAAMLVIGLIAFIGLLVLGTYAPDMRSGRGGGTHALSPASTGYAGIVTLARDTGRDPRILRAEAEWNTEDLVIVTPPSGTVDMSALMDARRGRATLIVLPKWAVVGDEKVRGWVDIPGLLPEADPAAMLAPSVPLTVTRQRSGGRPLRTVNGAPTSLAVAAPRPLQTVASPQLLPLVTDDAGRVVLGEMRGTAIYILADPDLLNNHGLRRLSGARAALEMLDFVNSTGAQGIAFDVTLNGLGRGRSPFKLAFEPPFLAMTLAIVVALALVGWQALVRFGAAEPPARTIAFGKTALIDNSAMIVRKARREGMLGPRYAALMRERARAIFGVPAGLTDDATDAYLDRLEGTARFSALAAQAESASHREDMLAAAQALHQWQQEKTG